MTFQNAAALGTAPVAEDGVRTHLVLGVLEVEHEAAVLALVPVVGDVEQAEQLLLDAEGHPAHLALRHDQVFAVADSAGAEDACEARRPRARPAGDARRATHLFHRISFSERRMFCRICEFGCDGVGLEGPRRPGAGDAKGTEVAMGFLAAPKAAEPGSVLEADVVVPGTSLACLAVGAAPDGAAESHGLLGMVPLKPGGTFLMAALAPATFTKGGDFFGRRLRGEGCLLPSREPGGATFLGAAAARFSSACLLSLTAVKETHVLSEAGRRRVRTQQRRGRQRFREGYEANSRMQNRTAAEVSGSI